MSYTFTLNWKIAVTVPTLLFIVSTFVGESVPGARAFTLTFGVPLVFFAGLLGAYIYQIRNFESDETQVGDREQSVNSQNID